MRLARLLWSSLIFLAWPGGVAPCAAADSYKPAKGAPYGVLSTGIVPQARTDIWPVRLFTIDGQRVMEATVVRVTPGPHVVQLLVRPQTGRQVPGTRAPLDFPRGGETPGELAIMVEAGKVYYLAAQSDNPLGPRWTPVVLREGLAGD